MPRDWILALNTVPPARKVRSSQAQVDLAGGWQFPHVVWTEQAVAMIAEDDTHARGLVKRHCL